MIYFVLFCCIWVAALNADEQLLEKAADAYNKGEYKEALTLYQEELSSCPSNQHALILSKMAPVFFKDQQQEKAFFTFLQALEKTTPKPAIKPSDEEMRLYQKALNIYLNHQSLTPQEAADKIRQEYSTIFARNSEYHLLGYLLSAAYANLGTFDEFFQIFYNSYQYYPDHYLAYKTKATLHIKLFEREPVGLEREKQKKLIYSNLKQAIERYPRDGSLYRGLIAFVPLDQKDAEIIHSLKKIIDNNIVISRSDILFFIREAAGIGQRQLAQKFLDRANEWYQYSRIINAAQQELGRINPL